MNWRTPLVVGLVLALPYAGRAQDPAAPAAGDVQIAEAASAPLALGEFESFKQTRQRFTERMGELEADTRTYLDQREVAERQKLAEGYDAAIRTLEDTERSQRALAIEQFEEFLTRYPDRDYANHVRFRLADLHWEQAREDWLEAYEEYNQLEAQLEQEGRGDELPPPPQMDVSKPIALYERIILENEGKPRNQQYEFLDGAYYALGFCYMDQSSMQQDEDLARQTFQKLIAARPDSPLSDDAHLFLGNFEFEANKYKEAIAEYRTVYDKGAEGKQFEAAMYQLAWAHYKLDEYDQSKRLFCQLLDHSDQKYKESGKKSSYAPDAIKYMAYTFADIADRQQKDPTEVARQWFSQYGARDYEWDIYVALGDALTKYGRFDQAVNVYKQLQKDERWRLRPENPEFQMQVVKLLVSGTYADLAASAAARIELTERYNDKSEWWYANRHNPEALATARRFIEESLADVAIEYRKNADEDQKPASYALAAEKFQEYLDKFPISDDYYEMQWYLADTLYRAKDFEKASKEYASLIKTAKHHKYGDGSLFQLMRARQEVLLLKFGPPDRLPENTPTERTYTSPWKRDVTVYALSDDHKKFIETADKVLSHAFAPPAENEPDFQKAVNESRAAIMYIPGQILFYHNRFDEARPRLLELIQKLPETDEAAYAAGLIVNSYQVEGDLSAVREYTKKFANMQLGADAATIAAKQAEFKNILEGTAFKQALALVEAGDREGAAEAFLQFIKDFPKSEYVKVALYNAANSYEIVGKAQRANELFEQYVQQYPKDEQSARLYFRIAANYESTFELDKAIAYYESLLKNFPKDQFAADAKFNAAYLRIGLGDHAAAAKALEDYVRMFPDREDAEEVYFMAGEQYEFTGAANAIKFYNQYLQKFGTRNADRALEAKYRIAQLYKEQGNTKAYDKTMDELLAEFRKLVAAGRANDIHSEARRYAAESAFREVQANYDRLVGEKLTGRDEKKDVEILTRKEGEVQQFRDATLDFASAYADFEYGTAVLYLRAASLLYYADLGFSVQPPPGLSDEEDAAFRQILEEQVYPKYYPIQDKAKAEFQQLIELSKEKKTWSPWVGKAYETLNTLDPFTFPAEKVELRGSPDASIVPEIRPMTMEPPKETPPSGAPTTPPAGGSQGGGQ